MPLPLSLVEPEPESDPDPVSVDVADSSDCSSLNKVHADKAAKARTNELRGRIAGVDVGAGGRARKRLASGAGMSDPDAQLLGRIEELEIHAAFQTKTVDDLDAIVRDLGLRVQRLEHELRQLRGLIEAARNDAT